MEMKVETFMDDKGAIGVEIKYLQGLEKIKIFTAKWISRYKIVHHIFK
jgi:hypothetical protein